MPQNSPLTHFDAAGQAHMVDVGAKAETQREAVRPILAATYGEENAALWHQRWRLFMMACEELFNYRGGTEWYVAHYRFAAKAAGRT